MSEIRPWGGDRIRANDGREGIVTVTSYSLAGKGTVYGIKRDGDTSSRVDMYSEADADRRIAESEVAEIVAFGRHDYKPNQARRGYCARCDVRKGDHA